MRLALVVLFFAYLYVFLRPTSPLDFERRIAQDIATQNPAPGTPEASPPASDTSAANPALPPPEIADEAETAEPAIRSGEAERAGEQRTSQRGGLKREDIEAEMQKELTRLACLSGRAERRWGAKARSALRRFVSRAKPKEGSAPTEALLRTMRGYPANYCRLCSPGQAACRIGAGAPQKKSEDAPVAKDNAPDLSYLPPWMQGARLAEVEDEVRTDIVAHTPPPAMERLQPSPRRKSAGKSRRPPIRAARGFTSPNPSGWPRGY